MERHPAGASASRRRAQGPATGATRAGPRRETDAAREEGGGPPATAGPAWDGRARGARRAGGSGGEAGGGRAGAPRPDC